MSKPTSINALNKPADITVEDLSEPLTYPVEAFISPEYAKAEADKLWAKVWQMAGRVEEIPEVGNYITYDIGDDSILIVRTAARPDQGVSQCVPASRPPPRRHARRREPRLRQEAAVRLRLPRLDVQSWRARTPSSSTRRTGRVR